MSASDRAMLEAKRCSRVAVTVAEFAASDLNGDKSAYWYSDDAATMGLECWALVEGIDPHTSGKAFDVWFASGKCMTVTGDAEIFIASKDSPALASGATK